MDRLEAEGVNINKLAQEARRINPAALLGSEGMPARSVSQLPNFLRNYGIAILCAIIIYMLLPQNPIRPTAWDGPANFVSETVQQTLGISTLPERPVGDYHLEAAPSLTAGQIDAILASYGSPAAGTGNDWVELGRQYDIDPAFAVAFFIHESTAGTNPGWAGIKPDGSTTHNVGNIICAGYPTCYGRFRDYPSWRVGIEDWYRLIRVEYLDGRNHQVVSDIIPIYAPAFENDVQQYRLAVEQMVDVWKQGQVP
jgi:hypothetical protein